MGDTWNLQISTYPTQLVPQKQGHTISLSVSSGWGAKNVFIEELHVQNFHGEVVDHIITDKWYFGRGKYPVKLDLVTDVKEKPACLLLKNGKGKNGVKQASIAIDSEQIWQGELPPGTEDEAYFPVMVPTKIVEAVPESPRPTIRSLRNMNVTFTLDIDDELA